MKRISLFYLILFFLLHTAAAQSIITIDVHSDGNAIWTMEKHVPLGEQAEIDDWEEFIALGQGSEQYQNDIEAFTTRIDSFLQSAEISSKRSMSAENFDLSYDTATTLSDSFGIVRFSFTWKNFAQLDADKILIGDVFSDGMILASDNILIIQVPDGYEVESVSPDPDKREGNRLIWDGSLYSSFDQGEPSLVLIGKTASPGIWILALVLVLAAAIVFYMKKKPDKNDTTFTPSQDVTSEDLGHEAVIAQILTRSGGQTHQSKIVKETGLSKSKISVLLSKMKEDGKIVKIKKGKENIIRLVDE